MGKMLHVLQEEYATWERCCMFYRKSTQRGKDVACFVARVRNMGGVLHIPSYFLDTIYLCGSTPYHKTVKIHIVWTFCD
ncbi:hypothetical protein COL83_22060 [Bacillus wiedmannii]|nr:hypothetical protein COL83_22060 [Bacillus wiedmannii]